MRYTFPKAEHLCLQRDINALFAPGNKSFTAFPLRLLLRPLSHAGKGPKAQVLISVSKRKFKHAVDRNRAKRQVREAYRLNKALLLQALPAHTAVHLAFIWISPKAEDSSLVHKRMASLLQRASEHLALPPHTPTVSS